MSRRLAALLQKVADGKLKRLMIFLPPRHGKSELVSRLFSAYYLYRHPEKWVGLNSYGADLAYSFSRIARQNFRDADGQISDESSAVNHWETKQKGGMWAAGVGGPITGKGFSLGIIDDPLKNHEEASSETIREKHKDWYDSAFYTRAEDDAAIIILQTRWHEDDLSGWLLSREYDDDPENWHIVSWEAIKERDRPELPPACTLEPDWREEGDALNPVRISLQRLHKISKRIRHYFWLALYQQRPTAPEGTVFKKGWLQYFASYKILTCEEFYISVDASFKKTTTGSFVVIQLWGVAYPNFYLLHQRRDRMGFVATKTAIKDMAAYCYEHFSSYPNAVLVEDKANGPAIIDDLRADISGLLPIEPRGDKLARAEAVSPNYEAGNVHVPTAAIAPFSVKDYSDELLAFPNGATDDQVDGSSQLISWVLRRKRGRRQPPAARAVQNW